MAGYLWELVFLGDFRLLFFTAFSPVNITWLPRENRQEPSSLCPALSFFPRPQAQGQLCIPGPWAGLARGGGVQPLGSGPLGAVVIKSHQTSHPDLSWGSSGEARSCPGVPKMEGAAPRTLDPLSGLQCPPLGEVARRVPGPPQGTPGSWFWKAQEGPCHGAVN